MPSTTAGNTASPTLPPSPRCPPRVRTLQRVPCTSPPINTGHRPLQYSAVPAVLQGINPCNSALHAGVPCNGCLTWPIPLILRSITPRTCVPCTPSAYPVTDSPFELQFRTPTVFLRLRRRLHPALAHRRQRVARCSLHQESSQSHLSGPRRPPSPSLRPPSDPRRGSKALPRPPPW